MSKRLAIIPARGGSKRIPGKNIKEFLGKPIIAYSIEAAIKTGLFDEVMVSTDSEQIAEIARNYGAKVPFIRSAKNSDDYAETADVISEVLEEYSKQDINFEYCCCIYPTSPLVKNESLLKGFELLVKEKYESLFPVVRYSHPIQRAYRLVADKLVMNNRENLIIRTQDLESNYHDAGQFYWMKVESFYKSKQILTHNTGTIILSDLEVQDIDTLEDWKLAEIKYKLLK